MLEKNKGVIEFKERLRNLYVDLAEMSQIIKTREGDILKEYSVRAEAQKETEGLRVEAERLRQQITAAQTERKNIDEENRKLRANSEARMREEEAQIARNLEQSKKVLDDVKKRESDLTSREMAFAEQKRDLEARHAKMAELVGKK